MACKNNKNNNNNNDKNLRLTCWLPSKATAEKPERGWIKHSSILISHFHHALQCPNTNSCEQKRATYLLAPNWHLLNSGIAHFKKLIINTLPWTKVKYQCQCQIHIADRRTYFTLIYIFWSFKNLDLLFNWKLLSCEQLEIRFLRYTKPRRLTFIVKSCPMKSGFSCEHLVNSLLFFMPWRQLLLLWLHFD